MDEDFEKCEKLWNSGKSGKAGKFLKLTDIQVVENFYLNEGSMKSATEVVR